MMTGRSKILSSVFLVVLVAGMATASGASAQTTHSFYTQVSPTNLTAEAKTPQELIATPVDEVYFKCGSLSATGAIEGSKVESVTVTPAYSECGLYEGETKLAVTFVIMETCHYVFKGKTVESKLGSHASVKIECSEAGDHVEVKATALKLSCVSMPEQEVSGLRYEDSEVGGVHDLSIESTVTGLETTTTPSVACPTESGKTETHNNGTLLGKSTLKGHSNDKTPAGIATTPLPQWTTRHITASEPWTPTASNVPGQKQVFRSTTANEKPRFECEEVTTATTGNVASTVDTVAVTPTYGKCIDINKEGTEASAFTDNGGCELVFKGKTTTGNPTGGEHATVSIEKHEKTGEFCEIKITATALKFKCAAIPSQEVKDAVRYEQGAGVGNEKDLVINTTAHGIENTTENSIACPTEKGGATEVHTDGSYVGKVTLKAHNASLAPVPLTLTEAATP